MSQWMKIGDSGLHRLCDVHGYKVRCGFKRSALAPTFHKLNPNQDLRYLTTFVSAVRTRFQSWKNFHEMNGSPAHGTKTQCFSVVSPAQTIRTGTSPNWRQRIPARRIRLRGIPNLLRALHRPDLPSSIPQFSREAAVRCCYGCQPVECGTQIPHKPQTGRHEHSCTPIPVAPFGAWPCATDQPRAHARGKSLSSRWD